ncbi:diguanylate cyclase domain-containing protein [Legionella cherrii]|uniref:Diguanylate cyclase (GGDEF) domain n=1 Tax=Legionella cherrii TaxID=28084 RepID=A0A0W0S8S7_9GAMM|nr:hypothetical protein Lche_1535 [Legionella cherrii]VEB37422.1 diguanylate cyclase (GGDEF) domain [Legionella cherrii]
MVYTQETPWHKFSIDVNQDEPISVTISIGISFYPYDVLDDLISKADESLYQAKKWVLIKSWQVQVCIKIEIVKN